MLSLTGLSQEDLSRLLSGRSHLHTLLMLFPEQTASPVHPRHHSPPHCTLQPTSLPRSPSTYPPKVGGLPQGFPCPHGLGRAPSASMTPQSSARAPMLGAERWLISRPPAEASLVLFPPTDKRLVPASPHRSPPTLSLLHWAWRCGHVDEHNPFTPNQASRHKTAWPQNTAGKSCEIPVLTIPASQGPAQLPPLAGQVLRL